jgi:uncharacterized protein (TIGR03032 family)
VLVDIDTDQIVLGGMSMPHSPRWHQRRLWVLNSGTGEVWAVEPSGGRFEVVCGLPGYLRGLCFVGPYALVGLCKIRERHIFGGLPIQKRFDKLLCGVAVVDLRSGAVPAMFEFTAGCEELYDVQFLPGIRRPMILDLGKPAVRQAMTNPDSSYWLRPSAEVPLGDAGTTGGQASCLSSSGVGQDQPPLVSSQHQRAFDTAGKVLPGSGASI